MQMQSRMPSNGEALLVRLMGLLALTLALLVLLLPGILSAFVSTKINLIASISCIFIALISTRLFPRVKWAAAACGSLVVAFPPYPNWLTFTEDSYLRFDPQLASAVGGANLFIFALSIGAFWLAFYAMNLMRTGKVSSVITPGGEGSGKSA
ncbi:MAG TPA: hypothetical protein VFQ84_05305 [Arenimonas sp.]|uniref:hypothetical protein n=1 Tax=Arenimonas sp. TaxID=1872635 RepID=UPI002D7EC240|nr:hypothetical protein [Arenimonas sp.]HEU0152746.1 hypothetical protein [Arenimonas sp.]